MQVKITYLSHERVPVLNTSFFNEVLLFHEPSKVLLSTDFFWCASAESRSRNSDWQSACYHAFVFALLTQYIQCL